MKPKECCDETTIFRYSNGSAYCFICKTQLKDKDEPNEEEIKRIMRFAVLELSEDSETVYQISLASANDSKEDFEEIRGNIINSAYKKYLEEYYK